MSSSSSNEEEIGSFVGVDSQGEWKMLSTDVNECRASSQAPPEATNFKLSKVPGASNQYHIQSVNPPGKYLYVDDYTKDTVSFVDQIPPSNGRNTGVFEMLEEPDHSYRIKLNHVQDEQFLTLFEEDPSMGSAKVQTQSGGKGKTQKWKFVKGGSGSN